MNPQVTAPAPQAAAPVPASTGITAASPQTPTAINLAPTPTYDTAGTLSAIQNYYKIPQAAAGAQAQFQAGGFAAGRQQEIAKIQSDYARELAQRRVDPSSYRLQPDPNGGPSSLYNIYTGEKVNALQYSQLTGSSPVDAYKNSQNTQDQAFYNDYNNLEAYMQARLNPDNKGSARLAQDFEDAHKNLGIDLKHTLPADLLKTFQNTYGAYFGGQGAPTTEQYGLPYSPSAESYFAEYANRPNITPNVPVSGTTSGPSPLSSITQRP